MKQNNVVFKNKIKKIIIESLKKLDASSLLIHSKNHGFIISGSYQKRQDLSVLVYNRFINIEKKYRIGILQLNNWNSLVLNPVVNMSTYIPDKNISSVEILKRLSIDFFDNKHLISAILKSIVKFLILNSNFLKKECKYARGIFAVYILRGLQNKYIKKKLAKSYYKNGNVKLREESCKYLSYKELKKQLREESSYSVKYEIRKSLENMNCALFDYKNFFKERRYFDDVFSGTYSELRIIRKEFNENLNRSNAMITLSSFSDFVTNLEEEQADILYETFHFIMRDLLSVITKQDALFYIDILEKSCPKELNFKLS